MRPFSLYRRGSVWYVQLRNPTTRKYLPGRSTGERDRRAAEHVADDWIRDGIPGPQGARRPVREELQIDTALETIRSTPLTPADAERIVRVLRERELIETAVVKAGSGSEGLVAFLSRFWDFDSSPYVREKLAHGHRIGRRHCRDMRGWVRTCWEKYFGREKRLGDLRKADLREFSLWLVNERHLKAKTVNTALSAGSVPLRWAHAEELVASNPAAELMKFSGAPARRGVLTEEEVRKVFELPWPDERAQLGNELAMSTGVRAGEALGLQVRDIGEDRLFLRHSWSDPDGLKSTKTGKEREVPLLGNIRSALLDLARRNPHGCGPTSFVFWSVSRADRPMDFHFLIDGLKGALVAMSLTEDERKDPAKVAESRRYWRQRAVVYHSWRHYYAARMADRLEARKVMVSTGHANGAVFQAYADHGTAEVFAEVRTAAQEAFGKLLVFPKTKGT